MTRIAIVTLLAAAAVTVTAAAAQRDAAVTSATLKLDREPAKVLVASITNQHPMSLVAWSFRIGDTTIASRADGAPIRTGSTYRTETTMAPFRGDVGQPKPVYAAFADGSVVGDREYLAAQLADHEAIAQRAAFLVGVLERMPLTSDADALVFVRSQRDARTTAEGASLDPLLARMQGRTREGQARAAALTQLTDFRINLRRATEARDALTAAMPTAGQTPIPISVVVEVQERPQVSVSIENRSKMPIIAWSVAEYLSGTGRIRRGGTTYYPCPDVGGTRPGTGYLQPGETRKLNIDLPTSGADLPHLEVSMILFADRRAEGDPAQRDEALAFVGLQTCR